MFELQTILLLLLAWLTGLYLFGRLAEKPAFFKRFYDNPLSYTLSLGGYSGAWAMLGSMSAAQSDGYTFLSYFFGTAILFVFAPLLLQPILNLSRTHRLGSLADLLSFRFNSKWAGALVTLGTLASVMPLLALQISAVSHTTVFLTGRPAAIWLSAIFSIGIALLTIRLGSTHFNASARHKGLVITVALQSLLKLFVMLLLGGVAIFGVFSSPAGLETWLNLQPAKLNLLNDSLVSSNSRTLMLIFSAAALAMPHMYHLAMTENRRAEHLRTAAWALPLYLLLFSLPVLPILWAGEASGLQQPAYFFTLLIGVIIDSPALTLLAWLAIMAAASACMMVILLSVASMCINHLVLPFFPPVTKLNVFSWLRFLRNTAIALLTVAAFALHITSLGKPGNDHAAFAAVTAAFQFLPAILSVLYWPKANHKGLIAGLLTGFTLWFITIVMPLLSDNAFGLQSILLGLLNLSDGSYPIMAAIASLGFNMLAFGAVSLLTETSDEERNAAEICSQDDLNIPSRQQLRFNSIAEFSSQLGQAVGHKMAQREMQKALDSLGMTKQESRPFALRLLRRQLEANLSGLFGPTVARQLINRCLPYSHDKAFPGVRDIQLIEHRLEHYQLPFSGITKELDNLRRYHRSTLEQLPIGVCTINSDMEILMWNQTMADLTGIDEHDVVGSNIRYLSRPWADLFTRFIASDESHAHNRLVETGSEKRWFTLHKAEQQQHNPDNQTILVEETTTLMQLEQELLHNERLASIGRLAAGVAHEIGNPVTGIACLAQNLKYDSDEPEIQYAARDILTQTQRINRIVQSLVNFAHAGSHRLDLVPETVNLYHCADDAIHLLSLNNKAARQQIENRLDRQLTLQGDTQLILQMFLNLLKNALDVIDDDNGHIMISNRQAPQGLAIDIDDNGPGIPAEALQHIFEPFFTTKDPGQGTGLGLSLVYGIVEEHGGHIDVSSPPAGQAHGTRFSIIFPADD